MKIIMYSPLFVCVNVWSHKPTSQIGLALSNCRNPGVGPSLCLLSRITVAVRRSQCCCCCWRGNGLSYCRSAGRQLTATNGLRSAVPFVQIAGDPVAGQFSVNDRRALPDALTVHVHDASAPTTTMSADYSAGRRQRVVECRRTRTFEMAAVDVIDELDI